MLRYTATEAAKLSHSAGYDAASRSARKAGRDAWNEEDYNAAVDAHRQTMRALGFGHLIDMTHETAD